MTTKHTPGPWGFGLGDNESQEICAETGEHICTVEQYPIKENALLIAAAPELLDALEHLASEAWQLRKGDVKKDYHLLVAHNAALKAIRKAKGSEQ